MTEPHPAPRPRRWTPLSVLAAVVLTVSAGAAALAIYIYVDLERTVTTPRENIQWAAYQVQAEHLRLVLAAREAELGRMGAAELSERYEIFVSRLLVLRDGDVYAPMRLIPGFKALLARAVEAIPLADQDIERDGGNDPAALAGILIGHFGTLSDPLQQVALQAVSTASEEQSAHQLDLLKAVSYLAVTLVLIVAASVALAGITIRQFSALETGRRELSAALRRAENSNHAKSRFLAGMSHEMRTPLNAVTGMLREIGYRTSDRTIHALVATAQASADMLCGLVDDVLDTTRIETGKFQLDYTTFDPSTLVEEVAGVLSSRAEDRGNTVEVDVSGLAAAFLVSDRPRLKQVLINLLGNAIKYTRDGTIMVVASTVPDDDGGVRFRVSVSDTGIGIAPHQRDRIFDRFFQAGGNDGLGLGLSISRDIVDRLGGRIGVESVLHRGSTFWFEVPVIVAQRPARPASASRLHDRLAGLRLLVAEDNATNRQVVRLMLERQGAAFDFATDGREAVALAQAGSYDLVLMDINMPVMDGLQAIAELQRRGLAGLPVIALTADALPEDHERFRAAGMRCCVIKPIDEAELLRAIASVLDRPDIDPGSPPSPVAMVQPPKQDTAAELSTGQRLAIGQLLARMDDDQDPTA